MIEYVLPRRQDLVWILEMVALFYIFPLFSSFFLVQKLTSAQILQ